MQTADTAINLMGMDHRALKDYFVSIGEKPFRATQVLKWIHGEGVKDPQAMTNLSQTLRDYLTHHTVIIAPDIALDRTSKDGTRKWLMKLSCGNCVETVYIPEKDRGTLCVSSQVGCALNCTFCSTGAQGFNRDLTASEIVGQVFVAREQLNLENTEKKRRITNVVMMGMGEPLLNFDNVVSAMNIMMDDRAYNLSKYRVTLSTSGVVPAMEKLAAISNCALAISLHAPFDELRNEIVPINKKYPLKMLLDTCKKHFNPETEKKRHITMEYVMLDGVNDSPKHAKELIKILNGIRCKVNLIPFNPFPGTRYKRSSDDAILRFQAQLVRGGLLTTIRRTRGGDIDGACGQLAGEFDDRTKRRFRIKVANEKAAALPKET